MAITIDIGKCAACGVNNTKSSRECRQCSQPLPWARAKAEAAPSTPHRKIDLGLGNIAWGATLLTLVGGLILLAGVVLWFGNVLGFLRTFSGAGYITGLIGLGILSAASKMTS